MPTEAAFPSPKRKSGNPFWGQPMLMSPTPALETEFEQLVGQLHLTKETGCNYQTTARIQLKDAGKVSIGRHGCDRSCGRLGPGLPCT